MNCDRWLSSIYALEHLGIPIAAKKKEYFHTVIFNYLIFFEIRLLNLFRNGCSLCDSYF